VTLEPMSDFFAARVEGYDEHMLKNVDGCREGYEKMAELLPDSVKSLLDLGCGTGLELDEIFKTKPELSVTGVDLSKSMLDCLRQKHPEKNLALIEANYFDADLGVEAFDAAVSFETMHHFSHEEKIGLYAKIRRALKPGGRYIECDYMVTNQKEEDFYYAENVRLRREQNIPQDAFYHYDTPCTVENQIAMLQKAGFSKVEAVWHNGSTTMIVAEK
jgi:tRNA (cmo5U34)-methyltransferase